jgi:hypothetical protein
MRQRVSTIILASAAVLIWVTPAAAQRRLTVPLRWSPTIRGDFRLPTIEMTGGIRVIKIEPFVDKRDKGRQIGENTEQSPAVPVYTDTNVAEFLGRSIESQLKTLGIDVSPTGADRVLKAEVREFWTQEIAAYHAVVRLKITLADAEGREIWTGLVSGEGGNWGRSLRPDNYNETFCNAVLDLIVNLVDEPAFDKWLKRD